MWLVFASMAACNAHAPGLQRNGARAIDSSATTLENRANVLHALSSELETRARTLVENQVYPGLSIAVVLDGRTQWAYQVGKKDIESGAAVRPGTCFRLASITKTVTALTILALRDEGLLALDDPISRALPQAKTWRPVTSDSPEVTWRHLLTHTSGLPRIGSLDFTRTDTPVTRSELETALTNLLLIASPGTQTRYSNLGYAALGLALSNITQESFPEFVTSKLLRPLTMTEAGFARHACADVATGYSRAGRSREETFDARTDWRFGVAAAVGGMYASARAVATWMQFQMNAWPPRNGTDNPVVKRATRRESHRLGGFSNPGQASFGIGWGVASFNRQGQVIVSHSGSTWTWGASVRMLVERGIGIVALGNSGGSGALSRYTLDALRYIDGAFQALGIADFRPSRARISPIRQTQ